MDRPGHSERNGAPADRFARAVAVCIVLATVAAAAVGYLQSQASSAGARAGSDAERYSAESFANFARSSQDAQVQYELFVLGRLQHRRAWTLEGERRFGVVKDDPQRRLEEGRWQRIAAGTERLARGLAGPGTVQPLSTSPDGPERDALFPTRFLAHSAQTSERSGVLREAANQEGAQYGDRITSYVVMLAMFAVAVYLFGFSLTPHGREDGRLFALVAGGLTAVAIVWAIAVGTSVPQRPSREASTAFAEARVAGATRNWQAAIASYTRAIELWPGFGRAYAERATTRIFQNSPQVATVVNLTRQDALRSAIADFDRARDNGFSDGLLENNLGYLRVQLGIREQSPQLLNSGIASLRSATRALRGNPLPTLNTALGHFAARRFARARDYLRRALLLAQRQPQLLLQVYVTSALTGLELALHESGGKLADQVRATKEFIVGYVAGLRSGRPAPAPRALPRVRAIVTPAWAQVSVPTGTLDRRRDRVAVYWYREEPGFGWAALEQVSGPVAPPELRDARGGVTFVRRFFLPASAPPTCLHSGRYRAELYVNGRLAGKIEAIARFTNLQATTDYDLRYAVCRPREWLHSPASARGLIDGYVAPDGSRGVYVARVPVAGGGDHPRRTALAGLDGAVRALAGRFPSRPELAGTFPNVAFAGGLSGEGARAYRYRGGAILAGFGLPGDGAAFTALVFGPRAYFRSGEPKAVYDSITER